MISHFPKHNVFFLSLFAGMTILLLATSRYVTAQDTADVIIAGAVAHWYFTAPQGGERRVEVSDQAPRSALLPQLRVRSCRH